MCFFRRSTTRTAEPTSCWLGKSEDKPFVKEGSALSCLDCNQLISSCSYHPTHRGPRRTRFGIVLSCLGEAGLLQSSHVDRETPATSKVPCNRRIRMRRGIGLFMFSPKAWHALLKEGVETVPWRLFRMTDTVHRNGLGFCNVRRDGGAELSQSSFDDWCSPGVGYLSVP